jgi:hypothetical protein
MHHLAKRFIALGYILGCLGYTLIVGLSPWVLIVWFFACVKDIKMLRIDELTDLKLAINFSCFYND